MYEIKDKKAAVRRVQRMLGITENGIYDERTKEAVIMHQREQNIKDDGVVDYDTFRSLVNKYRMYKISSDVSKKVPFKNEFPYLPGYTGEAAGILNSMIRTAMDRLSINTPKPRGPYYSNATAKATEELRKIFMLSEGNYIDEEFYNRLLQIQ